VVVVSVTRCWLTPSAAMVMDMVDTIDPFCAGLGTCLPGTRPRVSLDLKRQRLDWLMSKLLEDC
jgi:hypothetical protein